LRQVRGFNKLLLVKAITSLFVTITLLTSLASAQREKHVWYFGNKAGMDFNTGNPVALTDGEMNTSEGVSSISDSLGNMLFYTDGSTIWNKSHQPMANGTFLGGNLSTTQSVLIVPQPCSGDSIYYVFTLGKEVSSVLYNVVNINANNGDGAVIVKRKSMQALSPEKLAAIQHKNGVDFWIITHGWNSQSYFARLLSRTGISDPIQTDIGSFHTGSIYDAIGAMRPAHDGSKIAVSLRNTGVGKAMVEILDFDNLTGVFSNPIILEGITRPYGLEFSPDNSKLYVTYSSSFLRQYDLNAGSTAADIMASAYQVKQISGVLKDYGQLALGPDNKIYAAIANRDYLSLIDQPNAKGAGCSYVNDAVFLGGKRSKMGLPNLPQGNLYSRSLKITGETDICRGNEASLQVTGDLGYKWYLLPDSTNEISTAAFFTIQPDSSMDFMVRGDNGCPLKIKVNVSDNIPLNLGRDTTICDFQDYSLDAMNTGLTYNWSNGETTQKILIEKGGSYWVEVSNDNCTAKDTIVIDASIPIAITITNSSSNGCDRNGGNSGAATVNAQGGVEPYTYLWDTNPVQTTATANGLPSGTYNVSITDDIGCTATKQIVIEDLIILDAIAIAPGCSNCSDGSAEVQVTGKGTAPFTYRWDDENEQQTQKATNLPNGEYKCIVTDANGCFSIITVQVGIIGIEEYESFIIKTYPNPSSGLINFEFQSTGVSQLRLEIIDATGKVIAFQTLNATNRTYKTSFVLDSPGVYFYRLRDQGGILGFKKIIILN